MLMSDVLSNRTSPALMMSSNAAKKNNPKMLKSEPLFTEVEPITNQAFVRND